MKRCVWTICLALVSVGCGKAADPGPAATTTPETTPIDAQPIEKLDPSLTLMIPFDDGMHGCRGSINPFAAIGHAELAADPARPGKVLHLAGHRDPETDKLLTDHHRSAVVIDGRNVPEEAATIGVSVRFGKGFGWSDGKKTWLLTLAPALPGLFARVDIPATGLAVWKDETNDLVLGEYRFGDGRLSPVFASGHEIAEPDRVVCRIPTGKLADDAWARVRLGFDRKSSTVWLALDDRIEKGKVEFAGPRYNALIVACPPKLNWVKQAGLNGWIDDVVVSRETPAKDAGVALEMPAERPAMAKPEPARRVAVHLADSEPGATMEAMVRAHCTMVLEQQSVGGWRFSTAWPSGLDFLSRSVVYPYTKNFFNGSKDQNSAYCASMLIAGYFAVGDDAFLKGAEKTAETLLALQGDDGAWPSNAYWDEQEQTFVVSSRPHYASIEDHIQTMPIVLMMTLHNLTGKEVYQKSAQKGVDFLVMAQNPNGSWSHHWNRKIKAGQSARGHVYGGELNDSTTTDPMRLMLLMYRRTGEIKYLASWLRAAEWFRDAFIDKKAKGWAQQYDRNNNPVQARHFEQAAVGMPAASDSGARGLMHAYRLAGDKRYLEPVNKF
ncbi:MAG: pectate lyase, partial [Planctomycetota bacterium]